MIHELRTYNINPERWPEWLETYETVLLPMYGSLGEIVRGCWVDRANDKFIWIRAFRDDAHRKEVSAAVGKTEAWAKFRAMDPSTMVESTVVVDMEPASFSPVQ